MQPLFSVIESGLMVLEWFNLFQFVNTAVLIDCVVTIRKYRQSDNIECKSSSHSSIDLSKNQVGGVSK